MTESAFVFSNEYVSLYGILRTVKNKDNIIVMLPAATGTRVGPQRIYVEIARHLINYNVNSLTIDLPPNGDSFDKENFQFKGSYKEILILHYEKYLNFITRELSAQYGYKNIILLSISVGCMPILYYAEKHAFTDVILLSPNHLESSLGSRKKNIKAYYLKIFDRKTWIKLVTFKLNFRKIYDNVGGKSLLKEVESGNDYQISLNNQTVNILNIFGEKDNELANNRIFWNNFISQKSKNRYKECIIAGADHSFFGWNFKKQVCDEIANWITTKLK